MTKIYENKAFTLIETLIVVIILSIVAMLAIPMISSASSMQLKSAANVIASDLEYAKSLAIGSQQHYSVQFDTANELYKILDSDGVVITHYLKPGSSHIVDFSKESRLDRVDISTSDFDGSNTITFDYLGSPYSGLDTSTPMNSGSVTLTVDGIEVVVTVEPITGYIKVSE